MAKHMYHFEFTKAVNDVPTTLGVGMELEITGHQDSRDRYILGEHLANKLGLTFVSEERIYHLNLDF